MEKTKIKALIVPIYLLIFVIIVISGASVLVIVDDTIELDKDINICKNICKEKQEEFIGVTTRNIGDNYGKCTCYNQNEYKDNTYIIRK